MAITKRTEEDRLEVVGPFKCIQVRTATVYEEDGKEIKREFSRKSFMPGDDVSGESADVQALATQFHTQEMIDALAAERAENWPEPMSE